MGRLRLADLLGTLSLAADLAVGLPAEHAIRSCYIAMHLADRLGLSLAERSDLYYAVLLMDAGCTAWTSQIATLIGGDDIAARRDSHFFADAHDPRQLFALMRTHLAVGAPAWARARRMIHYALTGKEFDRECWLNTCEVAQLFARRLGMSDGVQTALLAIFEQWDGSGPNEIRGEAIPLLARIVYVASYLEVFHRSGGPAAAVRLAQQRRGKAFDPAIVDAFLACARDQAFWLGLEADSLWAAILEMEPDSPHRFLPMERLEDVALAFADFADLKVPHVAGHSRRVGDLAERIARRLRLPGKDVTLIRRAALMHDLGLVTVPSFTLDKPQEQLTTAERERLRLHPYYAERLLSHVPALRPYAPLAAAHHERMDGRGYHCGLAGDQIPFGARIIAAADRFDELTHDRPGHLALTTEEALARLCGEAGSDLWPEVCRALTEELGATMPEPPAIPAAGRRTWPAGLTDREVEILRLLSQGLSRRDVARGLFLSEHTVRHHLEHIYNKVGVSTRVGATLFAVENNLL